MICIFPSCGDGIRFRNKGFNNPKPFVNIKDKPLIWYGITSLNVYATYIVITKKLEQKYQNEIQTILNTNNIRGFNINLTEDTLGATETCYKLKGTIDPAEELIICNFDHYTPNWHAQEFLNKTRDYDVLVTTYQYPDLENTKINGISPYSFVKTNKKDLAIKFEEKIKISDHALNGIHYWKRAGDFFESAELLLNDSNHTKEKYISYTFNYLIEKGKKISYYEMAPNEYISLGTPEEIEKNLDKL